jgi:PKD repeat protein
MKQFKIFLVCLLLVSVTAAFAAKGNKATLISSSSGDIVLRFEVNDYDFENVITPNGQAKKLLAAKTGRMLEKGAPDLAKLTASMMIPDEADMQVEVLNSSFTEISGIDIAPSKGNLLRTVDPDTVPYEYGAAYRTNAFFPGKLLELGSPYIIRDFRGQAVTVYSFQYNPVTRVLRVYDKIQVKISPTGKTGKNILKRNKPKGKLQREFKKVYERHFINFAEAEAEVRYTPLLDPIGNMLIVCYSDFMDEMAPFVTWKQSIGYGVDLVNYSTIGSSSALKTYVANYYNTYGLTYLLLVGDHAQVPTSSTSAGDSDNNYGYIVGSDHYLDIFVGRFSAETSAHVTTQVDRTINYERDVLASAEFFRHAIGMGSSEGPGHNGEYDYQHINLILDDLEGYGYTPHQCHESGGSPALMSSLINAGSGTIFYCGHGSVTQWYTSTWQYTSTNVNNDLVNEYELPFIYSVACVVGNFKNYTCFCETWLRATNNGNPTGAVAHAGSTINQSWNPPMDAQDEMADILVSTSGPKRTFGGTFVNGLFKMIDINGSGGETMADTWTIFGDPSVQLRTPGTPEGPAGGNQPPVADFTYTINGTTVTFIDQSYDPDGYIVSWDWDFGDGTTSTQQNPIHTYAADGTYNVTLTVTDNEGANGTKTVAITVGSPPEIYVFDISMTAFKRGVNYWAEAVITIKDTLGNLVPNATVDVAWSGVVSGTDSGVTGSGGTVSFTSLTVKRRPGPFTITVTNVSHPTMNYNPSLNNETSDSATY